MHIIIFPLAIIIAALLIEELAFAIPHAISFISLISTTILIFFNDIVLILIRFDGCRFLANLRNGTKWLIGFATIFGRSSSTILCIVIVISIIIWLLLLLFYIFFNINTNGIITVTVIVIVIVIINLFVDRLFNVDIMLLINIMLTVILARTNCSNSVK